MPHSTVLVLDAAGTDRSFRLHCTSLNSGFSISRIGHALKQLTADGKRPAKSWAWHKWLPPPMYREGPPRLRAKYQLWWTPVASLGLPNDLTPEPLYRSAPHACSWSFANSSRQLLYERDDEVNMEPQCHPGMNHERTCVWDMTVGCGIAWHLIHSSVGPCEGILQVLCRTAMLLLQSAIWLDFEVQAV